MYARADIKVSHKAFKICLGGAHEPAVVAGESEGVKRRMGGLMEKRQKGRNKVQNNDRSEVLGKESAKKENKVELKE